MGVPRRPEDIDGLGEDVVVDQSSVDGEHSHEGNEVTSGEKYFPDFGVDLPGFQLLLLDAHPKSEGENDHAVAGVAEHDSKEEWESDDGEHRGVGLSVRGNSVSIDQLLEGRSKLVRSEEGWRRFLGRHLVEDGSNGRAGLFSSPSERKLNGFYVDDRDPALGDQTLLCDVQVEVVQSVVDGLDLANLDEPDLDVLGGCDKDSVSVIVGLAEDSVEVLQSLHHSDGHLASIGSLIRTRIKSCSESFADLLDSRLELLALEEDDEDGLVDLVAAKKRIFQRIFDLGLTEEDVAAASSPQHPFKCRKPFAKNNSGDESQLKSSALKVSSFFWKKLLMLSELSSDDVHLVLLLEELLSLAEDVLQFGQL